MYNDQMAALAKVRPPTTWLFVMSSGCTIPRAMPYFVVGL